MENTPIFVKIDEYKEIRNVINDINEKLELIKNSLTELKRLKAKEEEQFQDWDAELELVNKKMAYVSNTLKEM